jgi:hypothetical protein
LDELGDGHLALIVREGLAGAHRLGAEGDVHAEDEVVDGHRAVAGTVADALRRRANREREQQNRPQQRQGAAR